MTWLRIESNIFFDTKFNSLKPMTQLVWFYLLTECARACNARVTLLNRSVTRLIHLRTKLIQSCVIELEQLRLLKIVSRDDFLPTIQTLHNKQDKHNKHNTTALSKNKALVSEKPKPLTHWLIDLWNSECKKLPRARHQISESRIQKIRTRVKQIPEKETWKEAIQKLAASNFCNGQNNRSWIATFNWLLKPETLDKILDGTYDNRRKLTKGDQHELEAREQMQMIEDGVI